MLIFVTGGVRSGKSSFAEQLAVERSKANSIHYLATSQHKDTEMKKRITRHQQERRRSHADWVTWEVNRNLAQIAFQIEKRTVVLLDCLTMLLNNELFVRSDERTYRLLDRRERQGFHHSLMQTLQHISHENTFIIVSNEVFQAGIPTQDDTTFAYVEQLGKLHQSIVAIADEAYLCEHGIPLKMK